MRVGERRQGKRNRTRSSQAICALMLTLVPLVCASEGRDLPEHTPTSPAQEEGSWKAGVARIKITPERPLWMAGYASRNRPAEGTLIDIWAKALALEDPAGNRGLLITLDLLGVDRKLSQAICTELIKTHHLRRDQIAICSSHTHTAPATTNSLTSYHYSVIAPEQEQLIRSYTTWLQSQVAKVAVDALNSMSPCALSWGVGEATFAANRRENSEPKIRNLRSSNELKGPVDHSVPVLAVRDEAAHLKVVVFGYACHATTLSSYAWSGDYPGFAQLELEESHPDCTAMFWAGCGADQNPLPRRSVELCKHYGKRLAAAVDAVLMTTAMQNVQGELSTSLEEVDLRLGKLPSREQVELDAMSSNIYVAARAKLLLSQLERHGAISPTYPYPVACWKLGNNLQWLLLGGEVVVDYAVRLGSYSAGRATWVAGYTNDVMAYIPSRRVLLEGGYEGAGAMVYYGLPCPWSERVEDQIIEAASRLRD